LVEKPHLPPLSGEVEIQVAHVGICGSDLGRFESHLPSPKPAVFGHEFSGRVSALGPGVSGFNAGQAVTAAPLLNCGHCHFCQTDKGYLCGERIRFGSDVDGALREFVSIRADRVFALPADIPLVNGALAEPLAVAVHAIRQVRSLSGATVGVLGAGAIGLLVASVAQIRGADNILVFDINPDRVRLADELGYKGVDSRLSDPNHVVEDRTGNKGFLDIIFEATGSPKIGPLLLPLLSKSGEIVIIGRISTPVPLNLDSLMMKEGRILTSRYFSLSDFQHSVHLISSGSVVPSWFGRDRMAFGELEKEQGKYVMSTARKHIRLVLDL
jgi:2-desacetyl-2-hydroxyethyl bacteriochlorophyllide A dehydrogenase